MKTLKVLKSAQIERDGLTVAPFVLAELAQNSLTGKMSAIEIMELLESKNRKKTIQMIAEREGYQYDDASIRFTKKIITAMLNEINDEIYR